MLFLPLPGHFDADGNFVLHCDRQEGRRVDLEIGEGGWNGAGYFCFVALFGLIERDLFVLSGLACELDLEIGVNGCGCGSIFGQSGADGDHGKFAAAGYLKHVEIAVAVPGIEGFNRDGDQEIALSGVANALAAGGVADAIELMERVRDVVCESGLRKKPLAVSLGDCGKGQEQKD